jgi:hypothetical protein
MGGTCSTRDTDEKFIQTFIPKRYKGKIVGHGMVDKRSRDMIPGRDRDFSGE